jgi:cytoskeleton protein RodZ
MTDPITPTDVNSNLAPFAELRERQAMSISDVAQRTRMAAKQIEALDRGDYASLPGTAFTKGAIRSYCKVLGVDPLPYLDEFVRTNPQAEAAGSMVQVANLSAKMPQRGDGGPSDNRAGKGWLLLGAALMIVAIGFYFGKPEQGKTVNAGSQNSIQNRVDAANVPNANPPGSSASPATASTNSVPLIESPGPLKSAVPPLAITPVPEPFVAPAKTGLQFELSRDAWIEVRDGQGKVIASRLFKKGENQPLDVTPPINLVVGSASGVVATLNGKVLDLKSSTRDDVARLTISTP